MRFIFLKCKFDKFPPLLQMPPWLPSVHATEPSFLSMSHKVLQNLVPAHSCRLICRCLEFGAGWRVGLYLWTWSLTGSRLGQVSSHLCGTLQEGKSRYCNPLDKASHKASWDSRREATDSILWWGEHLGHIAKGWVVIKQFRNQWFTAITTRSIYRYVGH